MGREGERGRLFVGIDLCGGGAGDPAAPRAGPGMGRGGRWARGGAPGRPAAEQRRRRRTPRPVKLNKEGICCS